MGPDFSPTAMPRPRPGGGGSPPPDHLRRPLHGPGPVAVGRRVARDERFAAAGRGSAAAARAGSMPRARARLVHVRFDRPDLLRVAEAAEGGRGRPCARGRSARRSAPRGPGTARWTCNSPSRRSGRRCRRRPRSGSSPRCPGRRRLPSVRKPDRTRISDAPRRTAWNVSSSVRTRRTGRPARSAMNATSGSYFACCLPPKPPPGSGAKTRTLASGRSQHAGDDPLEPVRVLDRAPDRDPVAVRARR